MTTKAPHPWEYIQEEMNKKGWSIEELAKRASNDFKIPSWGWGYYKASSLGKTGVIDFLLGEEGGRGPW